MENSKIPAIALVGPTASGKTALAVEIAGRVNGEIVSADSMQIFKNMPIASAVPTIEDRKGVEHYLLEELQPDSTFSVSDFVGQATERCLIINRKGKMPIVAGGTGLYVDALINNFSFADAAPDRKLRAHLEREYDNIGGEAMLCKLQEIDKITADRLHPNDKKRIVRAFEIYHSSGSTLTRQNELSRKNPSPFEFLCIGLTFEDREKLYDRINKRVDIMLECGLEDEARRAFEQNSTGTGTQAIGHKEFFEYFKGNQSFEQAVECIKMQTRRLAKRQLTWFKAKPYINWIYVDRCDDVLTQAMEIIKQNGLV